MTYYSCICFKGFMTRFYYLPKDKKQQKIKWTRYIQRCQVFCALVGLVWILDLSSNICNYISRQKHFSAVNGETIDEETETDSEEEILFESSKKGRRPNGSIPNGYIKNGKLNT